MTQWLSVDRGEAPLLISIPHTGTEIPEEYAGHLVSDWAARKDADWWIDRLYNFASQLGATVVHTAISRTVIDVNRDPSGASLYPDQATTELCPTTTFDGEPLYTNGFAIKASEILARRARFFDPYHSALENEIERLRSKHAKIVLYDCHSIRSVIPRLFDGVLPVFNIGTNSGGSCDAVLTETVTAICKATGFDYAVNGRFKGGWITRQYGDPLKGVHAIQMELACRGYMLDTNPVTEADWPTPYVGQHYGQMRRVLTDILEACRNFARPSA